MIAGIASALGVIWLGITYVRDSRRNTRQDTLNAYRDLQREVLNHLNPWKPYEIKDVISDRSSEAYAELSGYLAEIERFCSGINMRIYDFKTFYNIAHGYFDGEKGKIHKLLEPLIDVKLNQNRNENNEDYYQNIHQVWNRMEKYYQKQKKRGFE